MTNRLPQHDAPPRDLETQDREAQSVPTLVHRLTHELSRLFRQELALATAELTQTASRTLGALSTAAAGAGVLYAGLLVLLAAAVLGLSQVMAAWLAALIVGVLVSAVGVGALVAGTRKLPDTMRPKRTVRSVSKDKDVLTRKAS
jgi:putative superfamily III holin-X